MSDLAIHGGGDRQLDPMTVAKVFRASGMFPDIQSEAAAAAKLIIGRGLGLSDYDAMSGLHIIKGKAVLAANLMAAAIKRAGKYDYRATCTDERCAIVFYGRDEKGGWERIGDAEFTLDDAKRAGLGGDNWRRYPKAMLFARCISAGYKAHCPDALGAAPVYVEAHGETEITEDAPAVLSVPAQPKALPKPTQMQPITREEREALFDPKPKPKEDAVTTTQAVDTAPSPSTDPIILLTWNRARIVKVTREKGAPIYRVDVDGDDRPLAITDQTLAEKVEANLAFKVAMEAEYTSNAAGKRIIHRIEEVGHG